MHRKIASAVMNLIMIMLEANTDNKKITVCSSMIYFFLNKDFCMVRAGVRKLLLQQKT